jgi:ATP-dependent DNA helicase RecQ
MAEPKNPQKVLKKYWGYDEFRPLQEDIIQAALAGKDVLALLPTGGGKSICYQVPGLVMDGLCLVVSPLIALMKDQVHQLVERGISAAAVHSGMGRKEVDATLNRALAGELKFLYLSPERLHTTIFQARFPEMNTCLIAVDEAHCISQWGHDFRPAYLQIAQLREVQAGLPIMALTASATPAVQRDIAHFLALKETAHFEKSFARDNLTFAVRLVEDKATKLMQIMKHLKGSGLVYCRTRKNTEKVAELLSKHGYKADFYHAGLDGEQRANKQEAWIKNQIPVMACTNAFGMGIDKPDVRYVIHWDLPDSPEAYYQEAGRAGRDGKPAYAILLHQKKDADDLKSWKANAWPNEQEIRLVYQGLANLYGIAEGSRPEEEFAFELESFARRIELASPKVFHALKRLQEEGYLQLNEAFYQPSRFQFLVNKTELYKAQVKHAHIDGIVKILLRVYGGSLMEDPVEIKEETIARALYTSVSEVQQTLHWMHSAQLARYWARSEKPRLFYLQARHDAAKLPLDMKALAKRKEREERRLDAMITYAEDRYLCRSLYLQQYFGEKSLQPCGKCDFCRKRKKNTSNFPAPADILLWISQKPVHPKSVTEYYTGYSEETVAEAIRMLIDQELLRYDEGGRLIPGKEK